MSEGASSLLASIPQLVKDRDAAGLVALQDHANADKEIRKAVRKALHTLKSRGIEIPESAPKAWSSGGSLATLRGDLRPLATVDATSTPGVMRFVISEPRAGEGSDLWSGAISADDAVIDFSAYQQTDGQRTRMLRDWQNKMGDRTADVAWLKARILWAREKTMARGVAVPRALDASLSRLGVTPSSRPSTFLRDEDFGDAPGFDGSKIDALINTFGIPAWPPMLELESMLEKAAQIHGDKPQPTEESDRLNLLSQALEGNAEVREGLQGPIATALDDVAIDAWLEGNFASARAAFHMAAALREGGETVEWAPRLIGYQVASLLRTMGGPEAIRKAMQEQQARLERQNVEPHVHGPDCDHDHHSP